MVQRVYLCEKPGQGKDLAKALGWTGGLKGGHIVNGDSVITWAIGHLLSQAPPQRYVPEIKQWQLALLPIIPSNWEMDAGDDGRKKQLDVVGKLLTSASEVVIATDFDREGETIAVELLEHFKYKGPTKRMKFSSQDAKSLRKAHDEMLDGKETYSFYLAGLARMRADWLMGMNLTMAMTTYNNKFLMRGDVLSMGRVQTPIVHLIVKREHEIRDFKSVDYFEIFGQF
jgi:DNA topoisomerase-3